MTLTGKHLVCQNTPDGAHCCWCPDCEVATALRYLRDNYEHPNIRVEDFGPTPPPPNAKFWGIPVVSA